MVSERSGKKLTGFIKSKRYSKGCKHQEDMKCQKNTTYRYKEPALMG